MCRCVCFPIQCVNYVILLNSNTEGFRDLYLIWSKFFQKLFGYISAKFRFALLNLVEYQSYHHYPLKPKYYRKTAPYRPGNQQVVSCFAHLVLKQSANSTSINLFTSTRDFCLHLTSAVHLNTGLFMGVLESIV